MFILGNPSKDRQRFVDAVVLSQLLIGQQGFRTSKMLLRRHSNAVFKPRSMLGFAKLFTVVNATDDACSPNCSENTSNSAPERHKVLRQAILSTMGGIS